ncbi:LysR family transcriptional regulator [Hydrocarboniphaga sp.]|jgi:DNA-binding transcriptional LysR family regulator|uniref:LysR family transcriptional regulator n=1 Tax=Hydrocarboniphaga TaxID=243627 RepID=UPI003A101D08
MPVDVRLKYVVAVARTGSFTAAAEAAFVTQSAITRSVADLEQQIGYSIFYRTSRGSFLTPEGRDFVDRATRLLEDTDELLRRPSKQDDYFSGTLRVGVGPASLEWRLIAPLRLLLSRHPGIKFDVSATTFERTVQLLRAGSIDVALGLDAAFSEWTDLRREPVAAVASVHFVRREHPILERSTITLDDLADFDYVSPSDGRPYGSFIRKIFEDKGMEWRRHVHVVDYFPLVRQIVASSDAIGIVSVPYAQTANFKARFVALDMIEALPPSPMCCALRKRWEPKPAVRAFLRAVQDTESSIGNEK